MIDRKRPESLIDLKSQHIHNRMVSDLRKEKTITNSCLKGSTINEDELHTTLISLMERMNMFCLSGRWSAGFNVLRSTT
jgi:hypothetical protein